MKNKRIKNSRKVYLTFGVTWGGKHFQMMPAESDLIVRLQEYIRLGAAAVRYHGFATGQQRLQSTGAGDVVRVHVRVHCNRRERLCR